MGFFDWVCVPLQLVEQKNLLKEIRKDIKQMEQILQAIKTEIGNLNTNFTAYADDVARLLVWLQNSGADLQSAQDILDSLKTTEQNVKDANAKVDAALETVTAPTDETAKPEEAPANDTGSTDAGTPSPEQ